MYAAGHIVTLGSCVFGAVHVVDPSDLVAAVAGPRRLTEAGWIVRRCNSLHVDIDLDLR